LPSGQDESLPIKGKVVVQMGRPKATWSTFLLRVRYAEMVVNVSTKEGQVVRPAKGAK